MGFPQHLVALLQSLYVNQRAIIRWNGEHTEEFNIGKGARQGCILSPYLFVTYTESGMREADVSSYGINIGGSSISNLRYADDTALIETSRDGIKSLTHAVNEAGKHLNLHLNVKKTKLLVTGNTPKSDDDITVDGDTVEEVDKFKYLGSVKSHTASCTSDIKTWIAISKQRIVDLQELWNDRNITVCLKVKPVKTLVWSALLYGAESWTLLKADENRIMAAEMWFWRKMLNVSWKEKRTNASILTELSIKRELLGKVLNLKLGYFGHILLGSGSPLAAQIIEGQIEGKRSRGRQKKQWFDNIKEWTGLTYTEAKRLAQDRTKWRENTRRCTQMVANRQSMTEAAR